MGITSIQKMQKMEKKEKSFLKSGLKVGHDSVNLKEDG